MRVTVSITVEVPATSISSIEDAAMAAGRQVARGVITEACQRIEATRGRAPRKTRYGRRRTILTRAGYVTIRRGRSRREDGSRHFPLDERLELAPHHEATPAVRARGCHLAACHPFREAGRLLS